MGIETAFIFGVLIGQWVLMYASWRAFMKFARLYFSQNPCPDHTSYTAIGLLPDKTQEEE